MKTHCRVIAIRIDTNRFELIRIDSNRFESIRIGTAKQKKDALEILQIALQARQRLELELPVVKLFRYPTIRALVEHLEHGDSGAEQLHVVKDRGQRQKAAFARRKRMAGRRSG